MPDEHGVDSGGVETADGVAGSANQGLAEQIEGRIVEDRQAGGLAGGVQKFPVERVLFAIDGVDANQVVCENGGGEAIAMRGAGASDGGKIARRRSDAEVLRAAPGGGGRGGPRG